MSVLVCSWAVTTIIVFSWIVFTFNRLHEVLFKEKLFVRISISSKNLKIFTLKKKIFRTLAGAQPRTSCSSMFKQLQVLPFPCQSSSSSSTTSVICQTTGPKPLPKRFLHKVRSRASSFNWQYPLLSLRSSSSF